jgi:hypothetical protein
MSTTSSTAIRLTRTPEVARALTLAKRRYPTLSDPELLKVGLAKLTASSGVNEDLAEIRNLAAYSLSTDGYLNSPEEDVYALGMGKKVSF